ncbi:hypothetical protein F5Y14DRAFT_452571 [Nemania sp. NC0429]|nr:hypothetical protein F5Y14DRAFT_452571 [Nemania sp. NC0429]
MGLGSDMSDLDADGQYWLILMITLIFPVYEVQEPKAEYDLVREESRRYNGGSFYCDIKCG